LIVPNYKLHMNLGVEQNTEVQLLHNHIDVAGSKSFVFDGDKGIILFFFTHLCKRGNGSIYN